ncbi:MAG: hypothetical protein K6D61_05365 [Prevotella sp.]|jgi:hypothetical protein|nr:hypothetical protein [Prevotella sp.]
MKKIFTLIAVALMAVSANAKEEIPVNSFSPWDNCSIEGSTITMSAGWKGGAFHIYRDMTEFDYVWILYSNASGTPSFGITYDEWTSQATWGPVFASTTVPMPDGSGIVGIKIDKKTIMVHGNAEVDGVGIGDVYAQHVQQLTIQGGEGEAQVTVDAIYFGSAAEFVADGGDVPVRPEAGGRLTMWEGELVYNSWNVSSTVDVKYFDVAAVGDIIYCSVKDVTAEYNPIFKYQNWDDFVELMEQGEFNKDENHFQATINEAALAYLQPNGLRFQGLGFTLTKVELVVPEEGTGIKAIETESVKAPMYNLSGQRVDASYKGVVIQNGHKFVNK